MKKSPLRKLSGERRKQVNKYLKLRRVFLEEHPVCEFCKTRMATEVHHKKGRGPFLCDTETFLAVCQFCHSGIHAHPKWARENGFMLDRLAK